MGRPWGVFSWAFVCSLGGRDAEERNLGRDLRELLDGSMANDGDVGPSSGRALQVPTQDRRPSLYRDVLEAEASRRPLAEHGPAAGSLHVVKPVRALTEHRHQVTLGLVIRDQHRKRDDAAAAPSPDLARLGTLGPDPGANTMA